MVLVVLPAFAGCELRTSWARCRMTPVPMELLPVGEVLVVPVVSPAFADREIHIVHPMSMQSIVVSSSGGVALVLVVLPAFADSELRTS